MPLEKCIEIETKYNEERDLTTLPTDISESQYCTCDPDSENDGCEADIGAPLQLVSNESNTAHIVGIFSFAISCGSTYPSIYTRVASHIDWIESIVWPDGDFREYLYSF